MRRKPSKAFTPTELLVVLVATTLLVGAVLATVDRGNAGNGAAVCLRNLRTIGQACYMYAADHSGYLPRGIMRVLSREYNIFVTAVLPYTGFDGDPLSLWSGPSGHPTPQQQRFLRRVLREVGQVWQCPDFPDELHDPLPNPEELSIDTSLLDYVASAFPIPFPQNSIDWGPGAQHAAGRGRPVGARHIGHGRLSGNVQAGGHRGVQGTV